MEKYTEEAANVAAFVDCGDSNGRHAQQVSSTLNHPSSLCAPLSHDGRYPSFPQNSSVHAFYSSPDAALSSPHNIAHPRPSAVVCTHLTSSQASFEAGALNSSLHPQSDPAALTNNLADAMVSRQSFLSSYISSILSALTRIHREPASQGVTLKERLSAVRLAANMSLVASVGSNNAWSKALRKEVLTQPACRSIFNLSEAGSQCRKRIGKLLLKKSKVNAAYGYHALFKIRMRGVSGGHGCMVGRNSLPQFCRALSGCSNVLFATDLLSRGGDGRGLSKGAFRPSTAQLQSKYSRFSRRHRMCICGKGLAFYLKILRATRRERLALGRTVGGDTRGSQQRQADHQQQSDPFTKEQIESLGGLVPGGRAMDVPSLLEEAADYIVTLQMQIEALHSLSRSLVSS